MIEALSNASLFREKAFIGGEWCQADSNKTMEVINPADLAILGTVPRMGAAETDRAIRAARDAFGKWRATTAATRAQALRRWGELMIAHKEDLAILMTAEQGKVLEEARGEIDYAASFLEWFAEEARRAYGDVIPGHRSDSRILVLREPVGVVGAITPWNFPSAMITRKAGAALAAGCTMVLKPASATPYSALALAQLSLEAGIPAGVFNVVTGSAGEIGGRLTASSDVAKISFTGSTEIGRKLLEQCAGTIKKVSMELGGNAPFIVFDDAHIDAAVAGAVQSKFRNSGQTCVCTNRLYVQSGVYDAFAEALEARVRGLKVGPGLEPGFDVGPLIDKAAGEKVAAHIEDAVSQGAQVTVGGGPAERGGLFFDPTVLRGATDDMLVAREETFGPLAALIPFEREEDAIAAANNTVFGLAGYFYSRDNARIWRVSEALQCGMIGVNTGLISTAVAPFGGMKQSGLGREGSKYGLDDYQELKYVCIAI